jgi:DtxR family transcriptional regulator, Mn-dependent transcriptional regulator
METWKEFEANGLSHSAAHHLLAIRELGSEYGGWARVSDIARRLGITRGSVSINLRTLKKRGLVQADEHRMVKLSSAGQTIVEELSAKKATVTEFFSIVLGLPAGQVEIDSCKIEHLISRQTNVRLKALTEFLVEDEALARFRKFHGSKE